MSYCLQSLPFVRQWQSSTVNFYKLCYQYLNCFRCDQDINHLPTLKLPHFSITMRSLYQWDEVNIIVYTDYFQWVTFTTKLTFSVLGVVVISWRRICWYFLSNIWSRSLDSTYQYNFCRLSIFCLRTSLMKRLSVSNKLNRKHLKGKTDIPYRKYPTQNIHRIKFSTLAQIGQIHRIRYELISFNLI